MWFRFRSFHLLLILQLNPFCCRNSDKQEPKVWNRGAVLAATLTLSQPAGADYAHPILVSTLSFKSHRRDWKPKLPKNCLSITQLCSRKMTKHNPNFYLCWAFRNKPQNAHLCSGQVGELAQQDAREEWNSKRVVTTTLISTYAEHLETKRRYRTWRRRWQGGRVVARRRNAMVAKTNQIAFEPRRRENHTVGTKKWGGKVQL